MTRICVLCPRGCSLSIEYETEASSASLKVSGNKCPKGLEFAQQEWFKPVRMLTSTVKTNSDKFPRIPVKTSEPIPKGQINEVMQVINALTVTLPVKMGEIIAQNVLDLGVDILTTLSIKEDENASKE